ncbi:flagellar assembly peptidoglycan hydrolase FlgJ [Saccharospirillum impatiens]|uniref:flagellar assembly peptidoglycan hydrolase FlgJ n=1 Tax=Saccharospirillum impatiens TaxID=169438 RepID=UPI000414479C|nr:flagellar assembly peptidoglycan hydrolase FlgJ [Saccharospirillum impatiens]
MASQIDAAFNYNDLNGLNSLKSLARKDDAAALKGVAQQFESMFINMMLKSMRDATDVMASDLLSSNETKFYRDMHDQQLSLHLAESGGYGLAEVMFEQMSAQLPQRPADFNNIDVKSLNDSLRPEIPVTPGVTRPTDQPGESNAGETSSRLNLNNPEPDKLSAFESPEAFIESLLPHAEQAAQRLGVEPRILVAQAALETGWGRSMIKDDQGTNSFNFFGIKADQRWQGAVADTQTHEYVEGNRIAIRDAFRAYDDPSQSFNDYVDFLKNNPRYQAALEQVENPELFVRSLQSAGYATDPEYANKILRIANNLPGVDVSTGQA